MSRTVAAVLALLAVLVGACSGGANAAECELPGVRSGLCPIPPDEREAVPDDEVEVLDADAAVGEADDAADTMSLDDLRGEVVVLNFWASWCGPCRAEQPELNAAAETLPDDAVTFLGVNIEDAEIDAGSYIDEFDVPYDSVFDPSNAYASRFGGIGPRSIPSTIVVDERGRVAVRIAGTIADADELIVLVSEVVEEG